MLRRTEPRTPGAVAAALARIGRVGIDASVRATACVDASLRSLDAIHVATAEVLLASGKRVSEFVTCDKRMAAAANAAGLNVVAPN